MNFVLRRRFRAITTEAQYGLATDGGRPSYGAEANILRINRDGRWSLGGEYRHSGALLESERGLDDPFRTLLPASDQASVNGIYSRALSDKVSGTLNGRFEISRNLSLLGLGPADALGLARPLDRDSDSWTGHLGLTLGGDLDDWRWSLTSNYDRARTLVRTDSRLEAIAPRDRVETRTELANAELLFNGPLVELPGGEVRTSLTVGGERRGLAGESVRAGLEQVRDLSRELAFGQASFEVPIASRRGDFLRALGNLSLNLNSRVEHFSDFGTLATFGYGLNWSPIEAINLRATMSHEEGAPSMQQLGDPLIATSGVRVLDFTRGETVDITRIDGGNPALLADRRRVFSLGARVRPIEDEDLVFTANFTDTRIENPIASFPTATAEIEAAFPDRFVRDATGRLVSIDARPVNFARSEREELRWGVNWSQPIGPQRPPEGWRRRAGGAPGGARPEGAPQEDPRPEGAPGQSEAGRERGERGPGRFGGFGGQGRGFGGRLRPRRRRPLRRAPPARRLSHRPVRGSGPDPRGRAAARLPRGLGVQQSRRPAAARGRAAGRPHPQRPRRAHDRQLAERHHGPQRRRRRPRFLRRRHRQPAAVRRSRRAAPAGRASAVLPRRAGEPRDRQSVRQPARGDRRVRPHPLAYRGAFLDPLGRSVRISFRKQFFSGRGRPREAGRSREPSPGS